jgi:hypothetical protein
MVSNHIYFINVVGLSSKRVFKKKYQNLQIKVILFCPNKVNIEYRVNMILDWNSPSTCEQPNYLYIYKMIFEIITLLLLKSHAQLGHLNMSKKGWYV